MRLSFLASIVAIASLAGIVVAAPSPLAASATDNTPPSVPPAANALPVSIPIDSVPSLPRRASSLEARQLGDLLDAITAPLKPVTDSLEPVLDKVLELLGLKAPGAPASASQLSPEQISHITAYVKNLTDSGAVPSLSGLTSSLSLREEQ